MAAIDRVQTNTTQLARIYGHKLVGRWKHLGRFLRTNECLYCGAKFTVEGYHSPYGISATSSENVLEECFGKIVTNG